RCRLTAHSMRSCTVKLIAPDGHVLAKGIATNGHHGRGRLLVRVHLTHDGHRLLAAHLGGISTTARGHATLTDGRSRLARAVVRRSILQVERFTTPPGSWVPDQPILTPTGIGFIQTLRGKLIAVSHVRCVGYTALVAGDRVDPIALGLARAKLTLALLRRL